MCGLRDTRLWHIRATYLQAHGLVDGSDLRQVPRLQFASMGKPDEYKRGAWTTEASDDCCEMYRTLHPSHARPKYDSLYSCDRRRRRMRCYDV